MPDESHDPKKVWQDQPMEAIPMSLHILRRRAQELQTKSRLAALAWMAIGLVLAIVFAAGLVRTQNLLSRIGLGSTRFPRGSLWRLSGLPPDVARQYRGGCRLEYLAGLLS